MKQGVRATYRGVASNVHRRHGCARTSSFTFLPRDFLSLQGLYDRTLFDEGQLFSSCCRRACVAAELLPKCLLDSTVFELLWFNWTLRFLLEEPGGGLACRYPNERHLRLVHVVCGRRRGGVAPPPRYELREEGSDRFKKTRSCWWIIFSAITSNDEELKRVQRSDLHVGVQSQSPLNPHAVVSVVWLSWV